MTTFKLANGKEYTLKLGYKQLKRLEGFYKGRSFQEILGTVLQDPTLDDVENLIYASTVDADFSRSELEDLLDATYDEGTETIESIMEAFIQATDESLFLQNLQKQEEAAKKKQSLKKTRAI